MMFFYWIINSITTSYRISYNLPYEQARALLAQQGLFLRSRSPLLSGEEQCVAYQSAPAGSSLPAGDVITVTLISTDDSILGRY